MKKRITTYLVICLLACQLFPSAAMAAEKSEIVYVNLRSGGDLDEVHVVNRFESNTSESVVDYGSYYKVTNLSDTSELEKGSDYVRLTVSDGTLFYQGDPISSALPWSFQIIYKLNGSLARAEDLSGQSGALEMQIVIGRGDETQAEFYEHYALSMTVTLDGNRCKNIVAENATIANSGTDRLLTYTILPSPDVTYTITADITDFSMADININGVPLGMDVDIDTSEIDDKLAELQLGVSRLSSGSSELAGGASSMKNGTAQLAAAAAQLVAAIDAFEAQTAGSKGLSIGEMRTVCSQLLEACSSLECVLSNQHQKLSALILIVQSLENKADELKSMIENLIVPDSDLSLLKQLLERASGNSDVLSALSAEISALRNVLDHTTGLNSQLEALRNCANENCALAKSLSESLSQMDEEITDAQSDLTQAKTALQSVLDLLDALEKNGASEEDGVDSSVFAAIRAMNDGMQALDSGIGELQSNFILLSQGISSVDSGVDSLAAGADTLLVGANSLASGADSLKSGVGELENGTSNMSSQVEEGVNEAVSSITGGEFEPVSYTDERNAVDAVQFVIRVPGVKEAEVPEEPVEEEAEKNFLEKFMDLF